MASLPTQDRLLNLMKMEKEIFLEDKSHLPPHEQERLWAARTAQLTSALGTTNVQDLTDLSDPSLDLPSSDQRLQPNSAAPSGLARSQPVIASVIGTAFRG